MRSPLFLWFLALVITALAARWQRTTGPTYPLSGQSVVAGQTLKWSLERTHGGAGNQIVALRAPAGVSGTVEWRRHGTGEAWNAAPMARRGELLVGELPHQPPAGKLDYRVALESGDETVVVPAAGPVTTRFKGDVPAWVLLPHVLALVAAMLLSTRAGLECFAREPRLRAYTYWTLAVLFVGGMVLGPVVLKYAFGTWWTGWPVGGDITDTKTLIALLGWIAAAIMVRRVARPRAWVLAASLLLLVVFLIPHSMNGTELAYDKAAAPAPAAPRP